MMTSLCRLVSVLLLFICDLYALNNSYIFKPSASVTNSLQVVGVNFDCGGANDTRGDIPPGKYVAPYVSGVKLSVWQVDEPSWCTNGSLEKAIVSFTFTASTDTTVEFRPDDNPCSSGTISSCQSAALNQSGMLAFGGGTWSFSAAVTAYPQGSTTTSTFDARAALNSGLWRYRLRGPAVTQVVVSDPSTSRSLNFGWKSKRVTLLAANIDAGASIMTVHDASSFVGMTLPFEISVGGGTDPTYWENMMVCHVSGNTLYLGNIFVTGLPSCQDPGTGRGVSGTTTTAHSLTSDGTYVIVRDSAPIVQGAVYSGTTAITVSDATAITSPTILQIGIEMVRVCNKSGNTVTVGIGSWGCSADLQGRNYRGTSYWFGNGSHFWNTGVPARAIDAVTDQWVNAPTSQFKSIFPEAVLTFPASWSGISAELILNQGNFTDQLQDQVFSIVISGGLSSSSTLASKTAIKAAGGQKLTFPVYDPATPGLRGYWLGSTPATMEVDFNLPYCFGIGLCHADPDLPITTGNITSLIDNGYTTSGITAPAWTSGNNSKCEADTYAFYDTAYRNSFGPYTRIMNDPGHRGELGYQNTFMSMGSHVWRFSGATIRTMREMWSSLAACDGLIPIHYLEHRNSLSFCNGGSYTGNTGDKACGVANQGLLTFGLFPSVVAYPDMNPAFQLLAGTKNTPIGPFSANGIISKITGAWSHMPNSAGWIAPFTGDYFATEVAISEGGAVMSQANAYPISDVSAIDANRTYQRGPFDFVNTNDGARSRAWTMRNMYIGRYNAVRGTARHEILDWALRMNIAGLEGVYNMTTGSYYLPCPEGTSSTNLSQVSYSPWCFGRQTRGMNSTMRSFWPSEPGHGYGYSDSVNPLRAFSAEGVFMYMYEILTYNMIARKAYYAEPFATEYTSRMFTQRMLSAGGNPWMASTYQTPANSCVPEGSDVAGGCSGQTMQLGREQGFSNMTTWFAANASNNTTLTGPTDPGVGGGGRTFQVYGIVRLAPKAHFGSPGGTRLTMHRARSFWQQVPNQTSVLTDPVWATGLWHRPEISVVAGSNSIRFYGTALTRPCKVQVSSSVFSSMDDATDQTLNLIGNNIDYTWIGLNPSTVYYYRVTCGYNRVNGTVTTAGALAGTAEITLQLKVPTISGIDTAVVNYGNTNALGSTASSACTTTCSVLLTLTPRTPMFYQVLWKTGGSGGTTRATSAIVSKIPN